ncbi:TPA: hypothetical protein HA265_02050, partial [Candidatus Woesearchaeota archaeon]|nr:hypothetical protein [Candidatus Woesearchaeota archaeon]
MEHILKTKGRFLVQLGLEARTTETLDKVVERYRASGRYSIVFGNISPKPRKAPETYFVIGNLLEKSPCALRISSFEDGRGCNMIITAE